MKVSPRRILLPAAAVLILAAALLLFLSGGAGPSPGDPDKTPGPAPTAQLVIDPNVGNSPTPAPTEPGVAIPGWGGIRLPANALQADVSLFNPPENGGWYYLTFQLILKDTGETLFQTGLIPPGMYCNKVELMRELAPGAYAGTMHVQPYTITDPPKPTNNADFDIQIHVL